jgi:hypothetical protein
MKKRKVSLNFEITNLDGSKVGNAGLICGQHLVIAAKPSGGIDSLKQYDWALAFYKGCEVTMDNSDFKKFRDTIETSETLSILVKGQVIKYLDSVVETD